jgi:hypothetical protein
VRQALKLLSEEPDASPSPTVASDDPPGMRAAVSTVGGDDVDTAPLPVILPGATAVPRPEGIETPRGPFEPARGAQSASVGPAPRDATGQAPEAAGPAAEDTAVPADAGPVAVEPAETGETLPRGAAEKLDEIKDLLITAEAIGEANLDRHFERVSQRQRELIREFFERAIPGREPES